MIQQNPNIAVWNSADQYIQSAEILFDNKRLHSAVVLSALAIELLLKSFLSVREAPWTARTKFGHSLVDLFLKLEPKDRLDLEHYMEAEEEELSLDEGINRFSTTFIEIRYPHEPQSQKSYGSDIIYFSRSMSNAVIKIAKARNM